MYANKEWNLSFSYKHTHRFVCMCWICDVTHTKHRHRLANFKINITCTSNWKHKSIQWTWKIAWISGVFWFYLQKISRLYNWMLFGHSMQKKKVRFLFLYVHKVWCILYFGLRGNEWNSKDIDFVCMCEWKSVWDMWDIDTVPKSGEKKSLIPFFFAGCCSAVRGCKTSSLNGIFQFSI